MISTYKTDIDGYAVDTSPYVSFLYETTPDGISPLLYIPVRFIPERTRLFKMSLF